MKKKKQKSPMEQVRKPVPKGLKLLNQRKERS